MDGIDAALLETDGESHIRMLCHESLSYDPIFKILLQASQYYVRLAHGSLEQAEASFNQQGLEGYLTTQLGLNAQACAEQLQCCCRYLDTHNIRLSDIIAHSTILHAKAVHNLLQTSGYLTKDIHVIGYHGQTLYHQPNAGISTIVGDGHQLAELTGIAVINDFRSQDLRLGGQGAPLAPIYHHALAKRDNLLPIAVVNCGGIANITIASDDTIESLLGFDTGPGNGLLDRLVRQRTQGQAHMDEDGRYGLQGKVNETVLQCLFDKAVRWTTASQSESKRVYEESSFFDCKPPKALDIGDLILIPELDDLDLHDACATLAAFTAESIVYSLCYVEEKAIPRTWILAGGGWRNPLIKHHLASRLEQRLGKHAFKLVTADDIGWHSQSLEAQIFAHFAIRTLLDLPLSVPSTTGVSKPTSGGQLYLPSVLKAIEL